MSQLENCIFLLMGLPGVGKQAVGKELASLPNFRLFDHHGYYDVFLKLFGDDGSVMNTLNESAWAKITKLENLLLSTIAEDCPRENSYVITQMMFDNDPYHQAYYEIILETVKARNAILVPVRLVCDAEVLAERVQSESRKAHFKTMDPVLSLKRSTEEQVFISHHPNEITIDNTQKTPREVVELILSNCFR